MKRAFPFAETGRRTIFPFGNALRTEKPADVTIILGPGMADDGNEYRRTAEAEGLDLDLVIPTINGLSVQAQISAVQARGRMARYCVLAAHGAVHKGKHVMTFPQGRLYSLDLIRHIRNGNRNTETLIHLHSCYGALARDSLRAVQGPHLICGGKKPILARVGRLTILDVLQLLAQHKRNSDAAPLSPQQIFDRASQAMGDTVSLVGQTVGCHIRYAKTPADLAGAGRIKIRDAFASRINVGNLAQAKALLDADPWLLDGSPQAGTTPLSRAWITGKTEMVAEMIRRDARWDRDLRVMVAVGTHMPASLPALVDALCKSASTLLAELAGKDGQQWPAPGERALECGRRIFGKLASGQSGMPHLDAMRALCGDQKLAPGQAAQVFQTLFDALSAHLFEQSTWGAGREQDFVARLVRSCLVEVLLVLPEDALWKGVRRCLDAGSVHGMLPLLARLYRKIAVGSSEASVAAWVSSVATVAAQELLGELHLPDRREILAGMLFCLGERSQKPMLDMATLWDRRCTRWQSEFLAATPQGEVDEFLMDILEEAVISLSTMLPDHELAAYQATLTADGDAPSEKTVQLLSGLLRDCAPVPYDWSAQGAPASPTNPRPTATLTTVAQD